MRRAKLPPPATPPHAVPRFEIDRAWLWRGLLALAVVGFILVLAKVSLMLFGSGSTRLERQERAIEQPAPTQPTVPAKPSLPR
jgi:hypothetical protein